MESQLQLYLLSIKFVRVFFWMNLSVLSHCLNYVAGSNRHLRIKFLFIICTQFCFHSKIFNNEVDLFTFNGNLNRMEPCSKTKNMKTVAFAGTQWLLIQKLK